jgi:acyl-CoA thioester hydrolase
MPHLSHHMTLTVRGYELDSYGHVNNAVYIQYLEQARWEFLRDTGAYNELSANQLMLVITETSIRYMREALLFDELDIVSTYEIKSPFVVFHQKIINKKSGLPVARATIKSIFLDKDRIARDVPGFMFKPL